MKRHTVLATLLAASTALAGAAYAADQVPTAPTAPPATQESPAQRAVDRDALQLSNDGASAFRDIGRTRLALFEADPAQAKTLINRAESALAKAKTDTGVFTKAEADLRQPAGTKAPASSDAATPLAWLPIDQQLTLGEAFVPTPQKTAAVEDANHSLSKGDQKTAAETLRLAGIDVNFTMAVVPVDKTVADVHQAATLIDQGKYYEANAILKRAEDRVRFDVVDTAMVPSQAANAAATQNTAPDQAKSSQQTKSTDQAKSTDMSKPGAAPAQSASAPAPQAAPSKPAS